MIEWVQFQKVQNNSKTTVTASLVNSQDFEFS